MTPKTKYFILVEQITEAPLTDYLLESGIEYAHVSNDFVRGRTALLYSAQLSKEEATAIRLKFPLIGFLDFNKAFKKPLAP